MQNFEPDPLLFANPVAEFIDPARELKPALYWGSIGVKEGYELKPALYWGSSGG
jgi:hypothetical protein